MFEGLKKAIDTLTLTIATATERRNWQLQHLRA
jgi:hypothetical protein